MFYKGKEFDLSMQEEREKIIRLLKGEKMMEFPIFSSILIGKTRVFEGKSNAFAFTTFNYHTSYFEIYINFEMLIEYKKDGNFLSFLLWHELMHNVFRHFRESIMEFVKKNKQLVNEILDAQVNSFLFDNMKMNLKIEEKNSSWTYGTLRKFYPKVKLDINKEDIPSAEKLLSLYKDLFNNEEENGEEEQGQGQGNGEGGEKNDNSQGKEEDEKSQMEIPDDHEASNDAQKAVDESNVDSENCKSNKFSDSEKNKIIAKQKEEKNEGPSKDEIDQMAKNIMEVEINKALGDGLSLDSNSVEGRLVEFIKRKDNNFDTVKFNNILKKAFSSKKRKSYKKVHRHKTFFTGVSLKGKIKDKVKKGIFAIDTSGSVSQQELEQMLTSTYSFSKKNNKEIVIDVIFWSGKITNIYKNISNEEELTKIKANSTGGTNIESLFDFIEIEYEEEKNVSVVIVTDGYVYKEKVPEIINELYFGLTENTSQDIKNKYPDSKVIKMKFEG